MSSEQDRHRRQKRMAETNRHRKQGRTEIGRSKKHLTKANHLLNYQHDYEN